MAELTISSDEIRGALERYVSSYTPEISREEVGIVTDAGDGIAQVEGLPSTMANELLEFEDGTLGVALNLDVREIGVVVLGDFAGIEEGQQVKRTGRVLSVPVGDAFLGRVVDPLGKPIDALRRDRERGLPRAGAAGAQRDGPPAGEGAAADRHQGDRRDDRDRPGPAPADHRRPQDRQDHGRARHDHQPARQLAVRRPEEAGPLHLRGDRAEGAPPSPSVKGTLEEQGAMEYTTIVASPGLRPGRLQVPRPVHRLGHRPALDVRAASTSSSSSTT